MLGQREEEEQREEQEQREEEQREEQIEEQEQREEEQREGQEVLGQRVAWLERSHQDLTARLTGWYLLPPRRQTDSSDRHNQPACLS